MAGIKKKTKKCAFRSRNEAETFQEENRTGTSQAFPSCFSRPQAVSSQKSPISLEDTEALLRAEKELQQEAENILKVDGSLDRASNEREEEEPDAVRRDASDQRLIGRRCGSI